jgi:hypothetical protein
MTAYDVLVDNKHVYNVEYNVLRGFSILTKLLVIFFIIGLFQEKPRYLVQILTITKVLLGIFLVYRFNKWRQHKVVFTELDRRVANSAGQYIILLAILDYVEAYIEDIRAVVTPYTLPFVAKIKEFINV